MKSKDLIAILQKIDPEGQTEVLVNNCDIGALLYKEGHKCGPVQILEAEREEFSGTIVSLKKAKLGSVLPVIIIEPLSLIDAVRGYKDIPVVIENDKNGFFASLLDSWNIQPVDKNEKVGVGIEDSGYVIPNAYVPQNIIYGEPHPINENDENLDDEQDDDENNEDGEDDENEDEPVEMPIEPPQPRRRGFNWANLRVAGNPVQEQPQISGVRMRDVFTEEQMRALFNGQRLENNNPRQG